jgi:8-oxo-dGTP pyrophosphatase MutT (NUDIX family)
MFEGRVVSVDLEDVVLPNGAEAEFEIVRHPGGAAIVAVDDGQRVCLLNQLRPAVNRWLWELPAGKRDSGEDPMTTARRELEEESGLHARHWQSLGECYSSPGVFTEVVRLFLATGLEAAEARPELHEIFSVAWVPLAEACERALAGDIVDSKTVIGLLRARAALS